MNKTTKLLFLLASSLAFGSTIPVTGSGWFSLDNFKDTYADFCMFGDGVSMCANNVPIGPAAPVSLGQLTSMDVSGVIVVTSYQEFETRFIDTALNNSWWAKGTFQITQATPEPSSMGLMLLGLVMLGVGYLVVRYALGK